MIFLSEYRVPYLLEAALYTVGKSYRARIGYSTVPGIWVRTGNIRTKRNAGRDRVETKGNLLSWEMEVRVLEMA